MIQDKHITLRIPFQLWEKIKERASKHGNRKMSFLVRDLLFTLFDEVETKP